MHHFFHRMRRCADDIDTACWWAVIVTVAASARSDTVSWAKAALADAVSAPDAN